MKCPECQAENREERKFCSECGAKLILICNKCGFENLPGEKFCGECGRSLKKYESTGSVTKSTPQIQDPTSFADNRYQIKDLLGEGGKKKVYRAYDTLLDREVALALIKTEGLDENAKLRITREAQAMGRVGTHPNIVTVFDLGEEDGQPFIVSEILGGGDVEGLIEKAAAHKIDIDQVVDIAQSICEGLQFAHNKGIVHRDLKPSNIYLTDEEVVKIGDFGLALVDDRTRLTMEGMMVGTVSYMAPEQATGGEVTPQSDLYSLGAMLYEMSTGRPPFVGDDHVAIIGQHINTPPVSPSWHNKDIPPSLEKLILSLLEKNPGDRPTSTSSVIQSLDLIKQGEVSEDIVLETTEADKRAPVYQQVFVGREAELKQLKTAFNNALSGQGSLMMVVGEPGIGKTTITQQLATYVTMRGGLTLVGHCYEEGSLSLPYLAFVEAMRTYVLNREETDLRRVMGSGASDVARIVSEVRDKLQVEPSSPTNPDEDRYRLFQAVTDFLSNASEVQPLLIVLEDLHDADKGTLDLLVYITRRMSKGRFLIVGTYRDVEVDRKHPLANTLAELRRVSTYERVLLRGLTVDEVQRMLSGLSGQDTPWQMAETVHRQTEGNPLFIQEVLRYVVEAGLLVRESGQWRVVDPDHLLTSIPEGLRDVIGKRLSNLSEECGQVLSIASVMGREFRFEVLQKVSNLAEENLFSALQEAIAAAVIEERSLAGAAVMYRFTHAFIRQALYEEMIAPKRNRLHIQIAHALEEVFASRLAEHAVELFDHFSHSTNPDDLSKAVLYGEMAAERANAVFDYGEAVRLLEQTLQVQEVLNPEDREKTCDLLILLSQALRMAGFPRRALDREAPAALVLAKGLGDKKRIASVGTIAVNALLNYGAGPALASSEFAQWVKDLEEYAEPGTIERAMADCGVAVIELLNQTPEGRAKANTLLDKSLDLSRRLGDSETFYRIASLCLTIKDIPLRSKERYDLAEELFSKLSEMPFSLRLSIWTSLAHIYLEIGKYDLWEEIVDQVNELAERTDQFGAIIQLFRYKIIQAKMKGHLEEADDFTQQVIDFGHDSEFAISATMAAYRHGLRSRLYLGKVETMVNNDSVELMPWNFLKAWHLSLLDRKAEANKLLDQEWQNRQNIPLDKDFSAVNNDVIFLETAVMTGHMKMVEKLIPRLDDADIKTTGLYETTIIPRHLGAGAVMLGRYDEAKAYYHKAIKIAEDMRFRPELALSRFQLAELLFEHFPDEKEEALEHLNFAIEEFKEMKMQPSLEKAEKLKKNLNKTKN